MAWRRKENTTTILVNDVSIINMVGAIESIVIKKRILRVTARSVGSSDSPIAMLTLGIGIDWL
jgi:hypothetical protein